MFQQRSKGRHIKKIKTKTKEANKYVDTLKQLKQKEAEIKERMLKKHDEEEENQSMSEEGEFELSEAEDVVQET